MSKRLTTEKFIENSRKIYGNKYDYSLVNYVNNKVKVKIIFDGVIYEQSPSHHLRRNCESTSTKKSTTDEFIKKAKLVHGDKYDYSLVNYINNRTNINILYDNVIYSQNPSNHLNGFKCENIKKLTEEEFIKKAKLIHGNKYDYSLVDFKNVRGTVKLIYNGTIYEQTAYSHLSGKSPNGTQDYFDSKGEIEINNILNNKKINYIREYKFDDCEYIKKLKFDFYLPDHNICIEFDGRQHYESVSIFGGDEELEKNKIRDQIKNTYCEKNKISLLRIPYFDFNNIEEIISNYLESYLKL